MKCIEISVHGVQKIYDPDENHKMRQTSNKKLNTEQQHSSLQPPNAPRKTSSPGYSFAPQAELPPTPSPHLLTSQLTPFKVKPF